MKLASFLHILQTTSGPNGLLRLPLPPPSAPIVAAALFSIRVIEFLALATTSLNSKSDPLDPVLGGNPWLLLVFFLGDILMPLLEPPIDAEPPCMLLTEPEEVISCA